MSEAPHTLAVAAIFRDVAPCLEEWLEYHRLVGVEHFWLYDDSSEDGWHDVLAPYLDSGLAEAIDWPVPSQRHFIDFQLQAYRDALKRAAGRTRWLALIDLDEFIVPLADDTVNDCLERRYTEASAVYVNWRNFGTGGLRLAEGERLLPRLTACSSELHPTNAAGKSIVRPEQVRVAEVWHPHHVVLEPDAAYFNGDGEVLPLDGVEPRLDGQAHTCLLRINHYPLRDEPFFHAVRLPRSREIGREEWLEWEHYHAFNECQDTTIVRFVRDRHPSAYASWGWAGVEPAAARPSVTARVYGRLGNNLFQVAAASALAWENGAEALFPDLATSPLHERVFFRCNVRRPDGEAAFEWPEPSYAYTPVPFRPNMRMVGYFQSAKYFASHRERVLELFRPSAADLAQVTERYASLLDDPCTVGVQLRYYRDEDPDSSIYPQYGREYLERAAALFPEGSLYVVTSNNLDFARANLPAAMSRTEVIDGEPDHIDLLLLSLCRHNIISNSSFGWWAAWLNQHEGKRIVRPEPWVRGHPAEDVCPEEWIAVEAPEA